MLLISGCGYKTVFDSKYYCEELKLSCTRKKQIVSFFTSKGSFIVQINAENYPVTASNFIENIRQNIYQNKKFYKIINLPKVKIIHSGIYSENYYLEENQNQNQNQNRNRNRNQNIINLTIPLEIKLRNKVEPIYRNSIVEPFEIGNIKNYFERGSIAMVKRGENNSSSTEFFFVTNKIPELDGRYSIFGKIVKGFEVLESINESDFIYKIKIKN